MKITVVAFLATLTSSLTISSRVASDSCLLQPVALRPHQFPLGTLGSCGSPLANVTITSQGLVACGALYLYWNEDRDFPYWSKIDTEPDYKFRVQGNQLTVLYEEARLCLNGNPELSSSTECGPASLWTITA
ncbi:hypothetical protein HDV03_005244 [Kappamyces sp. JEL0829]|nr:hypothetical protein HDV03_005244 [Kappamyces sp. JEL0829]